MLPSGDVIPGKNSSLFLVVNYDFTDSSAVQN